MTPDRPPTKDMTNQINNEEGSTTTKKDPIDHDRLFKELIENFFAEFMQLYFPEIHEAIDYPHTTFLSQEIFTDILVGEKRRVDILVETKVKGEESLIIVHIEPQSYVQTDFNERMFIYYSRLYEKHRRKIIPIAIFSYDSLRAEADQFRISFPLKIYSLLTFSRFHSSNIIGGSISPRITQ